MASLYVNDLHDLHCVILDCSPCSPSSCLTYDDTQQRMLSVFCLEQSDSNMIDMLEQCVPSKIENVWFSGHECRWTPAIERFAHQKHGSERKVYVRGHVVELDRATLEDVKVQFKEPPPGNVG